MSDRESEERRPNEPRGAVARVVARGIVAVHRLWRSIAVPVVFVALSCVAGAVLVLAWHLAGIRTRDQQDLYSQAGLLLGALGFVCTVALVGATIWYATLTKRLVQASDQARAEEAERWSRSRVDGERSRVDDALAIFLADAIGLAGNGAALAEILRRRPMWSLKTIHERMQPLQDDMVRVTLHFEQFRIASRGAFNVEAEAVFDATLACFRATCAKESESSLVRKAREIFVARGSLEASVAAARSLVTTGS